MSGRSQAPDDVGQGNIRVAAQRSGYKAVMVVDYHEEGRNGLW